MFLSRFVLPVIALASVLCVLAACGGGTAGSFNDALDTPDNSFVGISDGEFKAVRFNEAGIRDAALNSTIGFTTTRTGGFTEVTVAVNDTDKMIGVTMELEYDANRYNPVGAEFHGLVNDPIEAYIPNVAGNVGLGQVTNENIARSGDFVTVKFADGPAASLRSASVVHTHLLNETYAPSQLTAGNEAAGFTVTPVGDDYTVTVASIFTQGDGDDNGETNISDISPFIQQGNFTMSVSDTEYGPAATDYDRNGETNLSDIQRLVTNYLATCARVDFMLADSADMANPVVHEAIDFLDAASNNRLPGPFTTNDWAVVWRTWTSTVTAADGTAADTNGDGFVFVSARTSDGQGDDGVLFTGVQLELVPDTGLVDVTGVDVTIDTNPVGASEDLVANTTYALAIVGISGVYNDVAGPIPFVAGDATGEAWETEYDDALVAAQAAASWSVTNGTTTDFVYTGDCLTFDPSTGGAVDATAFPDWDPDSVDPNWEGTLTVSSSIGGVADVVVNLDIAKDARAPELDPGVNTDQGQDAEGDWMLNIAGETIITGPIVWGTTPPAADADTELQLYNFTNPGSDVNFTYTTDVPPGVGQFNVNGDMLIAVAAPVAPGSEYGLRIANDDTTGAGLWSSVNVPGPMYVSGDPPPEVDFATVPRPDGIDHETPFLTLLNPDPQIRRNPAVGWIDILKTYEPVDLEAYNDILKVNGGAEFALSYDDVDDTRYPRLTLIQGFVDDIGPATPSNPAVSVFERSANKFVIDIVLLDPGGGIGDPPVPYAYKLYGKYGTVMGSGEFAVEQMGIDPPAPMGVNWGLNAFDGASRGSLDYNSADWTMHLLEMSTAGTLVPDVFFVEFSDGTVENYPPALANGNVEIIFSGPAVWTVPLDIRTAGMDALGLNYIAIHEFVTGDYFDITNPDGLQLGVYTIQLDDPTFPGSPDFEFTGPFQQLTIVN